MMALFRKDPGTIVKDGSDEGYGTGKSTEDVTYMMDSQDADSCQSTQKDTQFSRALAMRSLVEEETKMKKYATLDPMDERLNPVALYAEYFELGRKPKLKDYCDLHELFSTVKTYMTISERHCIIQRDFDCDVTYLIDHSQFGTYVNSKIVGNGKSCVLNNMDIISLGDAENFVYMYMECVRSDLGYPPELTKRYHVSNHVLGVGAMGTVHLGKRRLNHQLDKVAIKAIKKKKFSLLFSGGQNMDMNSTSEVIKREVNIMLSIKHPNCVHLEYMCESPDTAYLVMEYIEGGELFARITDEENNGKGLGEKMTKFYAHQMLEAVKYLHKCNIVHRDIKPENVLLLKKEPYTVIKLSDFGLSKAGTSKMQTFCGTQCYMAPELFRSELEYDSLVDVWALGAVIFVCMVGYPPFSPDYPDMPLKEQICKGRLIFLRIWKSISSAGKEVVRRMLRVDTMERMTIRETLKHPWFNDPIVDYAQRVVTCYSTKREQVLSDSQDV